MSESNELEREHKKLTKTTLYKIGYADGYAAAFDEATSVVRTIHKNTTEQVETFEHNAIAIIDKANTASAQRIKKLEAQLAAAEDKLRKVLAGREED